MNIPPLKKTYGSRTVLNTPELCFESGRIYAIIGANGSGKSTFAKLLAGVEINDGKLQALNDCSVGYMPQKSYAFRMSTKSNIMLGGSDPEKCEALMKALHIEQLAGKPAYRLSGGETSRMALARLMMRDYELVILDEPTAAMDMESTLLAESLMVDYCRRSRCVMLLVTHSIQQARRIADNIMFVDGGKLAESGSKDEVLNFPKAERMKRFLEFYGI